MTDPDNFFDTIAIDTRASDLGSSDAILAEFHKFGINLRKIDENALVFELVCECGLVFELVGGLVFRI